MCTPAARASARNLRHIARADRTRGRVTDLSWREAPFFSKKSFPYPSAGWDYADLNVLRAAVRRPPPRLVGIFRKSAFCDLCRCLHRSHFTRNVLSAQELAKTPPAKRFCHEALALQRQLFRLWHRFRGDPRVRGAPLSRPELITRVLPIEKKFFALAARHVNAANADVSN